MTHRSAVDPNQLTIPHSALLVPENEYTGMEQETRISLGRLVTAVGATVSFGPEPGRQDYAHAEPSALNGGLYIHPNDGRYPRAQHLITVGVSRTGSRAYTSDYGLVFPSTEFATVARNSHDFARHTVNKTRKAIQRTDPERNRDDAYNDAMRSAGHALVSKMTSQDSLARGYEHELSTYRALYRDIKRPPLSTRYYAKNLEKMRALADEKLHEMVEVASINTPDMNNAAVDGLHRVVRKKLYHGNYSQAERAYSWQRYITTLGVYTDAKLYKLMVSRAMCERELVGYQPYLDARARQEEAANHLFLVQSA